MKDIDFLSVAHVVYKYESIALLGLFFLYESIAQLVLVCTVR